MRVFESIKVIRPVAKAQLRKPTEANPGLISPRHVRVIQGYAAGKHLTEIAREEKTSRGTILRILRTTPFRLLEYGGIIEP